MLLPSFTPYIPQNIKVNSSSQQQFGHTRYGLPTQIKPWSQILQLAQLVLFRCGMLHPPLNLCYGSNYVTLNHGCNVKLYLSFNIALSMRTTVIKEELYCHDNDLANLSLVDIRLNSIIQWKYDWTIDCTIDICYTITENGLI